MSGKGCAIESNWRTGASAATPPRSAGGVGIAVPALSDTPKNATGAKQLYDEWAATYDDALESWGYPAPTRVAEELARAGGGPASRVLDLGCGTGMSGAALRSGSIGTEAGVIGSDISQQSLDLALAKGLYVDTVVANLDEALPWPESSFDAVSCVGVMSYVERFDVLFREIVRVLKPGGVFVATHREVLWDEDSRGCKTEAVALEHRGEWTIEHVGPPEPYMPNNPNPEEAKKKIRLLTFRKHK